LCVSIAVSGTIVNLAVIIVIIFRRLYQQKQFIFVLNFFVGNLLMSSVALPLLVWFSFSSLQNSGASCLISGYAYVGFAFNLLVNMTLISFNRYVQIVHFNHYTRIFSTRNICVILVFAWLFYPTTCLFPLASTWGRFTLDALRLNCTPYTSSEGFRMFTQILSFIVTAPVSFCYIGIIRKAISSGKRVNITHNENIGRKKNERQLIRSGLVLITFSTVLHIPIIISYVVDPNMELIGIWFHCLAFYLLLSICLVNGLTEALLNRQIKTSFQSIVKQIWKRYKTETLEIPETEMEAISR
jgi:hypothetical protein